MTDDVRNTQTPYSILYVYSLHCSRKLNAQHTINREHYAYAARFTVVMYWRIFFILQIQFIVNLWYSKKSSYEEYGYVDHITTPVYHDINTISQITSDVPI